MTIPFGHTKYLPAGSAIRLDAEPLGRDYGQTLDKPIDLYRETEPLSQQHIARHWHDFTQ